MITCEVLCSHALLITTGSGAAEFVAEGGGQDLQLKVCKQLKKALQPAITNLRLDWGELNVKQAPAVLPPLFNGNGFSFLSFFYLFRLSHSYVFRW